MSRPSAVIISGAEGGCAFCGRNTTELELHHLSPKLLFGEEADEWPQIWLCRRCHRRWHTKVDYAVREGIRKEREAYASFKIMLDPTDSLDPLERLEGEPE